MASFYTGVYRFLAYLFLAGAAASSCAWGTPSLCEKALANEIFKSHYHDSSCYISGKCHQNILRLIDLLKGDIDISASQVLILPSFRMSEIRSDSHSIFKSTQFQDLPDVSAKWNYHVVLYFRGEVYDFDFSNQPSPVALRTYMANALESFNGEESAARLSSDSEIFVVEPSDYVNHFEEIDRWIFNLSENRSKLTEPVYIHRQTLGHYLRSYDPEN